MLAYRCMQSVRHECWDVCARVVYESDSVGRYITGNLQVDPLSTISEWHMFSVVLFFNLTP